MAEKSNRLSIYLIKEEYSSFDKIVVDDAATIEVEGIGNFYFKDSHPQPPAWIKNFFGNSLTGKFNLIASSAKGLLLFKSKYKDKEYTFGVAFGTGRHLLKDDVIEERFGLKVVLNSVTRDSLRSIDKTTLGANPKQSREQVSRASTASTFGIDIEQDLLNAVTGHSRYPDFGKTITGRDALSVSAKRDITTIRDYSSICLDRFFAKDYKVDYDWVDQIKHVRNLKEVSELDATLTSQLLARNYEKIWMAAPDILDWVSVAGFKYAKRKNAELYADLDIGQFVDSLGERKPDLEALKSTQILVISSKNDEEMDHWPAYKCIYAEVERKEKMYILHNSKWYEIAKDFSDEIFKSFKNTIDSDVRLPDYTNFPNEGAYNKSLEAALQGSHCMDANMIMHGGGHSSVEFCDLITPDKRLLYVKHYSGSAQLSHLFSQGIVAGELFVQDQDFRKKLNEKFPDAYKLQDATERPHPEEYEIVFAIISKSLNPLEIPFFSKVSLRSAKKRLEGYGYKVTKKKIFRKVDA